MSIKNRLRKLEGDRGDAEKFFSQKFVFEGDNGSGFALVAPLDGSVAPFLLEIEGSESDEEFEKRIKLILEDAR